MLLTLIAQYSPPTELGNLMANNSAHHHEVCLAFGRAELDAGARHD